MKLIKYEGKRHALLTRPEFDLKDLPTEVLRLFPAPLSGKAIDIKLSAEGEEQINKQGWYLLKGDLKMTETVVKGKSFKEVVEGIKASFKKTKP